MEDGRWKMEDGRWKMEDGGWRMEDGGWRMEDGRWRMEDGRWKMEDGRHYSTTPLLHYSNTANGAKRNPEKNDSGTATQQHSITPINL